MGMAAAESQFHVLAVDDSLIDRKLIERLFRTSSCQVTTVDSGSKALEFLGLHEHDENNPTHPSVLSNHPQEVEVNLVITDYCMPGMTGYDLLKKIKESSYLRNIPVVIMSSENVPSRISRCLEEGAEEFFLKPVRLSDVNKLRPHMMKTKCNKKPENDDARDSQEPSPDHPLLQQECAVEDAPSQCAAIDVKLQPQNPQPQAQTEEQQPVMNSDEDKRKKAMEESLSPERTRTRQEPQGRAEEQEVLVNNNENKRKAMDERLSPDRTRPRYNGLTHCCL